MAPALKLGSKGLRWRRDFANHFANGLVSKRQQQPVRNSQAIAQERGRGRIPEN